MKTDDGWALHTSRSMTKASSSSSSRRLCGASRPGHAAALLLHPSARGSPPNLKLRYRGIDPTGPLPDSVDFPLKKVDEPQKFDVIVFTDPQPESQVEVDFIRDDVVNGLIGTKAAFGMTTGDIMFDDLSLYPRFNRIIGQIGLPWYKSVAITISTSRRQAQNIRAKHSSGPTVPPIMPSNTVACCF